ncbi:ATP-binding cassette sub-family F member 3 [Holothuria leucospilota]|uniref:ATP-binding cassette sub-family F member 3 n=1 Tax=Holothuria leucospilota TaxID=206669 RepID=A0A9Q0YG58_HOLLE|nr:ATP-binding cassette sub-family F member 3 [Holothuria leucospilota]
MSAYMKIVTDAFPTLDSELLQYVEGVIEGGADDFESAEDVYEAIGAVLSEVDSKEEEDILEICNKLYNKLSVQKGSSSQQPIVLLDAPVQISSAYEDGESLADSYSWITVKDSNTTVNKKKLEKAEAKLKAKQERRLNYKEESPNANGSLITATASQVTSRRDIKQDDAGTNRSKDIRIEKFDIAFGDKILLKEADLLLAFGRRYGLVGRNGAGKSTLLKMISSKELRIQSHFSILHVEQEVVGDDTIAVDSVLECDELRTRLLKEEKELNEKIASTSPGTSDPKLSARLTQIYSQLEAVEADKAPSRAAMILAGLGFTAEMQAQETRKFSGGWRMRLALARALFSKPDLLLLDEPTNMLDMKAILWLEGYLKDWPTTLLVVSHDKQFLREVATDIIYQHSCLLDAYKGNYDKFVQTKEEKLKNQIREYEAQMQFRAHAQVFIDKFRYNAKRASLVQSKLKQLEKLPELKPVVRETEVKFRFPCDVEKLSPPIIQMDEVGFYYTADRPIFKSVDLSANLESRICIVGDNGSGKTTLLKIILGQLDATSGICHIHRNLRIGYFNQHHVDQMDLNKNAIEVLADRFPGLHVEQYRTTLGGFGVSGELATRPVSSLSGGQKSRVAFAIMCMSNPNFFVLDEPTNHLDIETVEALGKALNNFKGGVILVSHDESLIRMVCKELWVCGSGTVKTIEGGIDAYKKMVEEEFASQK